MAPPQPTPRPSPEISTISTPSWEPEQTADEPHPDREDEPRIAAFVERGLRANGFTTTVLGDGALALDLAMTAEFDLLVLDIGLPIFDGSTVLRRLRAARNAIPVLILTARSEITDTVAALEGGADDYMSKPFRFEEMLARIRLRLRSERTPEVSVLR